MDVSKITIPGYEEPLNIKDVVARREAENAKNSNINFNNRNVILLGDSYATGYSADGTIKGWIERLKELANFKTVYSSAINGAGFLAGATFLSQLQEIEKSIENKDIITDIVVVGGYNDKDQEQNTLANAVITFCTYVKSYYKNAILHIGCAGWSTNYTESIKIATKVTFVYKRAVYYGARWMSGVSYSMHNYDNYASDGYHPNEEGQIELTSSIYNSLLYASIEPTFILKEATCSGYNGFNYSGKIQTSFDNGFSSIWTTDNMYFTLTPKTLTANENEIIATITGGCFTGVVSSPITEPTACYVPCYVDYDGSENMQICQLSIGGEEGVNKIRFRIIGVDDTTFTNVKAILIFPWKIASSAHLS